jgi:hypothetical protein
MVESHNTARIAQTLSSDMDANDIPGGKHVAVVHDNEANRILCSKRKKQVKKLSYQQENDYEENMFVILNLL